MNRAPLLKDTDFRQRAPELGLKDNETETILEIQGRLPTECELGIFSAIWSEHCSYKSSRAWLSTLHTSGDVVIHGPGENAGVIDIGDNQAIAFKMESHNHPSFIEPYQGAATGVGGVLRDIFTMGARPIATLNALRFGDPEHPKTRHLLRGVVAGISGYGNSFGVPTVGGEVNFDPSYNGNILVNTMAVGLLDQDKIFLSAAAGVGNPLLYVGAATGKDGIHGASMASASFADDAEVKRPTVQVGDPFMGKVLCDASLALMRSGLVVAVQDMGAAGLTSSSVEMASKGRVGVKLNLDHVPQRASDMSAFEIMLSESQERMLVVLKAGTEEAALKVHADYALSTTVIREITDTNRLEVVQHGACYADIPVDALVNNAPLYHRPYTLKEPEAPFLCQALSAPQPPPLETLKALFGNLNLASKRWVFEQYDCLIRSQTLITPGGGDAAVVRIPEHNKAIALTSDCMPAYVFRDPEMGGMQAVVESWRNLIASGAKPLALTNNLNFANPEDPRIMGQIVGAIKGISQACTALNYPVVSGNVSLYNSTGDDPILPTPVIGGVGLIEDQSFVRGSALSEGQHLVLLGTTEGHLSGSRYLEQLGIKETAAPPPINLEAEQRNGYKVIELIRENHIQACHDVADGGVLLAIAEMCLGKGVGITLYPSFTGAEWFAEDQARYLLATNDLEGLTTALRSYDWQLLGRAEGDSLVLSEGDSVTINTLQEIFEHALPNYLR
ncbi:MAG: phosphoribosylformylglycinamidine synthase subunit PurL [Alphaproteobacteria bacterium]|nr:phosphoribosylformylglycinamidine synthase subunit PurL [Alphaproteobacteria bacterium]